MLKYRMCRPVPIAKIRVSPPTFSGFANVPIIIKLVKNNPWHMCIMRCPSARYVLLFRVFKTWHIDIVAVSKFVVSLIYRAVNLFGAGMKCWQDRWKKLISVIIIINIAHIGIWKHNIFFFWITYDLGQKYYTPQVRPDWGSNSWPLDHNSIFHATETPGHV